MAQVVHLGRLGRCLLLSGRHRHPMTSLIDFRLTAADHGRQHYRQHRDDEHRYKYAAGRFPLPGCMALPGSRLPDGTLRSVELLLQLAQRVLFPGGTGLLLEADLLLVTGLFFIADLLLLAGTVVNGAVHIHPLPPGSAVVSAAVGAAAVFLIVIGPAAGLTVYVSHSAPPVAVSSVTVYHALPGNTREMQRQICQTSSGVCSPLPRRKKSPFVWRQCHTKGLF